MNDFEKLSLMAYKKKIIVTKEPEIVLTDEEKYQLDQNQAKAEAYYPLFLEEAKKRVLKENDHYVAKRFKTDGSLSQRLIINDFFDKLSDILNRNGFEKIEYTVDFPNSNSDKSIFYTICIYLP